MPSVIKGWNQMSEVMQKKLEEFEQNGYDAALRWDAAFRLIVRFFQKEKTHYCLLMATSIAHDAGNVIRGVSNLYLLWEYGHSLNYTMEQYMDFISKKRYGNVSTRTMFHWKWDEKEPTFDEVKEFLSDKTPYPFDMVDLKAGRTVEELKEYVLTHGVIVVNLYAADDYNNCTSSIIPPANEYKISDMDKEAGHAVVVTGWRKTFVGKEYAKYYSVQERTEKQLCWELIDSKPQWGVKSRSLLPFRNNRLLGTTKVWAIAPAAPSSAP